jgi:hypothetical protein
VKIRDDIESCQLDLEARERVPDDPVIDDDKLFESFIYSQTMISIALS